jgi:hypothetical protein
MHERLSVGAARGRLTSLKSRRMLGARFRPAAFAHRSELTARTHLVVKQIVGSRPSVQHDPQSHAAPLVRALGRDAEVQRPLRVDRVLYGLGRSRSLETSATLRAGDLCRRRSAGRTERRCRVSRPAPPRLTVDRHRAAGDREQITIRQTSGLPALTAPAVRQSAYGFALAASCIISSHCDMSSAS